MRLFINKKHRIGIGSVQYAGPIFMLAIAVAMLCHSCRDASLACESCRGYMECHPSGEFCQCDKDSYYLYNYNSRKWECSFRYGGDRDAPTYYSKAYVFNGDQFGLKNSLYELELYYDKPEDTLSIVGIYSEAAWNISTEKVIYKKDALRGDSIYIHFMYIYNKDPIGFDYNGQSCYVTGRGRISLDRDTLDMTTFIIPYGGKGQPGFDPKEPIDVSGALDVRKMLLLGTNKLRKY